MDDCAWCGLIAEDELVFQYKRRHQGEMPTPQTSFVVNLRFLYPAQGSDLKLKITVNDDWYRSFSVFTNARKCGSSRTTPFQHY